MSNAPVPDFISAVVLKNYQFELSYILAELFNMCPKESFFVGRPHLLSLYLRVLRRGLTLSTTALLVFLWLVRSLKNLEIFLLISSRNVALFYFQYGFRLSCSTAYLLNVVSDRNFRAFNRSGVTRDVTLNISKEV